MQYELFWDFPPIFVLLIVVGNTVWPQASGFQKFVKMYRFWHFPLTFVHSKCKRSSLRDFLCDFQTLWVCTYDRKGAFLKIITLAPLILKILKETRAKKKKYEPFFWCTLESKFVEELQYFYCYTISSFFFFFFSCVFWAQKCWLQLRRGRIEWFTVSQCWICFVGYPLCHTHWK